ncbi:conserved hypothetical protein [Paecilomyces variotii No. 5]|uniref:Uncharacterized protein n=1 Tax=Byssochlamys spectabilis (strain No. 5 / NBRC 109023) TaxID=1356009 RepID=V5HRW7_BYSSN|nr:conserved hypothetical protein [Paecilomyces variotii No. 5]
MADRDRAGSLSEDMALPWILEHVIRYPSSYEIPLRSMYAVNSAAPNGLPQPQLISRPSTAFSRRGAQSPPVRSPPASPTSPGFPLEEIDSPAAQFRAQLLSQLARLPAQPCSLPPKFVTSFLRRCFSPDIDEVDFPQALTGLDYLRDLEMRRRKEVLAALKRLGLDQCGKDELAKKYPGVQRWLESMEQNERSVEALYTQVYIGLRRWIMLNELLTEPYNRTNCVVMLNTLFPPAGNASVQPTSQLTPKILQSQRAGLWRYINDIEINGKHILNRCIQQGAREGDKTGWPPVRDALDKYLRLANSMIDECDQVSGRECLEDEDCSKSHKGRKVDSGISFGAERPAPVSTNNTAAVLDKPLPPSPTFSKKSNSSTLERIAKELRKMGEGKSRSLKKMRSTSALNDRHDHVNSSQSDAPFFDAEEFKRKRMIWEATNKKKGYHTKQASTQSH